MNDLNRAMVTLQQNRPDKPRSLERKQLQQAIDVVAEYLANVPMEYLHRCEECDYFRDGKCTNVSPVADCQGKITSKSLSCGWFMVKNTAETL